MTFLPLPPQAMKVLSKKKLLKQYGFPRMYLLGPMLGSSLLGGRRGGHLSPSLFFVRTGGRGGESMSKGLVVGMCLVGWGQDHCKILA